jgi:hypothetical protein
MRKITNRRIRMAAIAAALAVTGSVLSAPAAAVAAPVAGGAARVAAADDPEPDSVEGETEILTVAEDAELAKAGYGQPITRATVMTRAKDWYSRGVPYNQKGSAWDVNQGKKYRTDCSGFVSMAWKLKVSKTTWTLDDVSHVINWNDLLPGDAVVSPHHHAVIFEKWVDSATKADFITYEEHNTALDMEHMHRHVVTVRNAGYQPYRLDDIRK